MTCKPYVVIDLEDGTPLGAQHPVLDSFDTEMAAAAYISTLPGAETGRYALDGPPEVDEPVTITSAAAQAIRRIVEYNWCDEERNYAEQPGPGHIFGDLMAVRHALDEPLHTERPATVAGDLHMVRPVHATGPPTDPTGLWTWLRVSAQAGVLYATLVQQGRIDAVDRPLRVISLLPGDTDRIEAIMAAARHAPAGTNEDPDAAELFPTVIAGRP